jgi:hypothetical protein
MAQYRYLNGGENTLTHNFQGDGADAIYRFDNQTSYNDAVLRDSRLSDDKVVGSPGGTASTYHHWTKGFYGMGGSSSDKFGGDSPRYLYGEYGNLYNAGPTATDHLGYYPQELDLVYNKMWQNQIPPSNAQMGTAFSANRGVHMLTRPEQDVSLINGVVPPHMPPPPDNQLQDSFVLIDHGVSNTREHFTPDPNATTSTSGSVDTGKHSDVGLSRRIPAPAFWITVMFILVVVIASLWAAFGTEMLKKFNKDRPLSWKKILLAAVVLTGILGLLLWIFGLPISLVEKI